MTAEKALHELCKEAGSLVCATHGIHAASRFLRHADIAITAAHYLDKKQRVTVGFSALAAPVAQPAANVIEFTAPATRAETAKPKRRA